MNNYQNNLRFLISRNKREGYYAGTGRTHSLFSNNRHYRYHGTKLNPLGWY